MLSASSDAKRKVALMRLAWDLIGSEFGSRHQKFYGGASFLLKQNVYRNFDFKRAGTHHGSDHRNGFSQREQENRKK